MSNIQGDDRGVRRADKSAGDEAARIPALDDPISAKEDGAAEEEFQLGLKAFRAQDYVTAASRFQSALLAEPGNNDWQELFRQAGANVEAEANVHVPPVYYSDREKLLAPPFVPVGRLPSPPVPVEEDQLKRVRRVVEDALGAGVSLSVDAVTYLLGALEGYRDEVWTNWYRRQSVFGILTLAYMRNQLNKHNLISTYPTNGLIGFEGPAPEQPPGVTHFRTADGSWNNLQNPKEGAAGTRFPRNVRFEAIRPASSETLLTPNPREISRWLLTREGPMKDIPFLNMLAAAWINFENHDWISHGESISSEVHKIPLSDDDPLAIKHRCDAISVGKTQPDPTRAAGDGAPITFINEVTHWWDGSQIYGSDQETQDRVRSGLDGKLWLNANGTLPLDDQRIEKTGFTRNWWVGLSMLHALFAAEHNAICDRLKASHPTWDDSRLFNIARLINAAVMAKIHSVEWTPAILPNHVLSDGLNSNWYGLLTNLFRKGSEKRTLARINVRNPEMGGVVGNPINKHGSPFGLTEEFVEVYRLHSLLPEELTIRSMETGEIEEQLAFPAVRQAGSGKLTERRSMADLFYSFGNQLPGQLVLNNYPRFLQELSIPGNPILDMGAVDILRARERGVPRYNEFRRQLGLNPIRTLVDLTHDYDQLRRLTKVYGSSAEDIEGIDLLVGTLAEAKRPTGFGFGETLFQIFILNATRRLQADRFYTDNYNEETYTREGLQWIDKADLKGVLLRHFPQLKNTGLANIKNAFEPWDTDELDPARHPLREFDAELGPDRWRGDATRGGSILSAGGLR